MLQAIDRLDRFVSFTRPAWAWVGQLAVVVLGVHLAADRLDDLLTGALSTLRIAWPDPEMPLTVATWCAVAVELAVVVWAGVVLLRATAEPVPSPRAWLERASVRAVLAPLLFVTAGLAGTWVVQMAVEDATSPVLLGYAPPLAWLVAAVVAWRVVVPGVVRVVRQQHAARRIAGLGWAPLVLVVVALAVEHGLPVWGWLP